MSDLPPQVIKAEAYSFHDKDEPVQQTRCHNCNSHMWTWSEREDICERCVYEFRVRRQEESSKQPSQPATDPYADRTYRGPIGLPDSRGPAVDPFSPTPEARAPINPFNAGGGTRRAPKVF